MAILATSRGRGRPGARAALRDLCRRGLDADAFRRALRACLHAVVPFDAYCVNTTDPRTLAVTSSIGDGLDAAEAARLFAIEHAGTDPNVLADLARGPRHVATIGACPERSERMRAIFLPRGYVDELRAALVERGRCWGYLHLFRKTPFTPAEIRVVASIVKSLVASAEARGVAAASTVPSRRGLLRLVALTGASETMVILESARRTEIADTVYAEHGLTAREREICDAVLRGLSDKQIASALDIGTETVKAHMRAAFAKLEVSGRGGLLATLGT